MNWTMICQQKCIAIIATQIQLPSYSKKYIRIKYQIEKHYTNRCKTWLAQAYNTHFNTPWTMIAFLAASLALLLTLIQTWCAIHPNN
jgi:hypothetical protein